MKDFFTKLSAWVMMALFTFAAIVSPKGLGIEIAGASWLSPVAQFIGNLIPASVDKLLAVG